MSFCFTIFFSEYFCVFYTVKYVNLTLKYTKMRLAADILPDPLGRLKFQLPPRCKLLLTQLIEGSTHC